MVRWRPVWAWWCVCMWPILEVQPVLVAFSEVFPSKDPMGMTLSNHLVVLGFATRSKSAVAVAAAKGTIRPGDRIVGVNQENVTALRLNQFLRTLTQAAVPRTIHFHGERTPAEVRDAGPFFTPVYPVASTADAATASLPAVASRYERLVPAFHITYPGEGLIGIQFAGDANSTVVGFSRSAQNELRQAERTGGVRIGDVLLAVNGHEVDRMSVHELLFTIARASHPRVLSFVRHESTFVTPGVDSALKFEHLKVSSRHFPEEGHLVRVARGAFGSLPSCTGHTLLLAEPVHGCGAVRSSVDGGSISGSYLVVARGQCSFTEKARLAQSHGASGLVVVNAPAQPLVRMPFEGGTDVSDINIVAVMAEHSLMETMLRATATAKTGSSNELVGRLYVSGECLRGDHTLAIEGDTVHEITPLEDAEDGPGAEDRVVYVRHGGGTLHVAPTHTVQHGTDGGLLRVHAPPSSPVERWEEHGMEIVAAMFGPKVLPLTGQLVRGVPTQPGVPCGPFQHARQLNTDTPVLVIDGSARCGVEEELRHAGEAGAAAIVYVEPGLYIRPLRQVQHPSPHSVPTWQLPRTAGAALLKFLRSRGQPFLPAVTVVPDVHVGEAWRGLESIVDPANWPPDEAGRQKLYVRLMKMHQEESRGGSYDREVLVRRAFADASVHHEIRSDL